MLAQLELEQATSNRQVIGSSPICPIFWVDSLVGQSIRLISERSTVQICFYPYFTASGAAGSMPDLGSGGRGFNSCHSESFVV